MSVLAEMWAARGFLDSARRQQRDDRLFLLPPEFCSVTGHLRTSADIWQPANAPLPNLRPSRFFPELTCVFDVPERFM